MNHINQESIFKNIILELSMSTRHIYCVCEGETQLLSIGKQATKEGNEDIPWLSQSLESLSSESPWEPSDVLWSASGSRSTASSMYCCTKCLSKAVAPRVKISKASIEL
jgi:hypothetical protein